MEHGDHTDVELIRAANDGDEYALETLYWRHRNWVASVAYRFTSNHEDTLDVLQEVFAYFFSKFPGFVLTAQLRTFLYTVARNLSLTRLRKRRRETPVEHVPERITVEGLGGRRDDFSELLKNLTEGQREVVMLRFMDDLKMEEIAEVLGIPVGTVKSRLKRGLGVLRIDPRVKKYASE